MTYLPAGMSKTFEAGNFCRDQVVHIVRHFVILPSGASIFVAMTARPPIESADAPIDRLQALTIQGRPAVLVKPVFAGDRARVYVRHERGVMIVAGHQIEVDEILKVAEGVR
jgi:hypothetical protein